MASGYLERIARETKQELDPTLTKTRQKQERIARETRQERDRTVKEGKQYRNRIVNGRISLSSGRFERYERSAISRLKYNEFSFIPYDKLAEMDSEKFLIRFVHLYPGYRITVHISY